MTWPKYVLLAWYAVAALITVGTVGKPRQPLKPSTAAMSLVLVGGMCALVVIA
jgi:hypothetical protein